MAGGASSRKNWIFSGFHIPVWFMGSKDAKLHAHKAIKLQSWYACFYLKEWNLVNARNNNNNRPPGLSNELAQTKNILSRITKSSFQPPLHPLQHLLWLPLFPLHKASPCMCTYAYWKTSQILTIKPWDVSDCFPSRNASYSQWFGCCFTPDGTQSTPAASPPFAS